MAHPFVPAPVGASPHASRARGVAIDAVGVVRHQGNRRVLDRVSLSVRPGELVAIAGGSGAGKSTLLETLAGLRAPTGGRVLHDGAEADAHALDIGFVPQDDIIHRELPLRRTLEFAAGLRLPAGSTGAQIQRSVDQALRDLDLTDRADVRVGSLSGGQRKRACIAAELLTRPQLLLLDEPTSGLDPATAVGVLGLLHRLAASGVTVVLTTHSPTDIERCDRVAFLARDGLLAFVGTPTEARSYFAVDDLAAVYLRLADESGAHLAERWPGSPSSSTEVTTAIATARRDAGRHRVGPVRQWALLARRSAEVTIRNRLTIAILLGSPMLITMMMATLFRPGEFDPERATALGPSQAVFWMAFAGFFFGLTYGLLQIVGEMPVVRRERLAGLRVGSYVAAKVTVLTPVLAVVVVTLLGVLRLLDRLPAASWRTYLVLAAVLMIESVAALGLGLLASAVVVDAAQATLALPMLCFPQVLFAGGVVPVADMGGVGQAVSAFLANRWAYEALGRTFDLGPHFDMLPSLATHGDAFRGSPAGGLWILAATAVVTCVATAFVLHRRTLVDGGSGKR